MLRHYFFILLLLFAAPGSISLSLAADPLQVVVSIKPIHSIMSGLMQGVAEPLLLVNDDQTPFNYRPDNRQRDAIQHADLVIWVGPELETFLSEAFASVSSKTQIMELLSHPELKILPERKHSESRDPWFWLDSRNALLLLDIFTQALIDIDPVRSHVYVNNRRAMLASLSQVDRELEYGYRGMKAGVGYLYYDSLQYFEQAYALKIRGTLLNSPNEAIDAATLLQARQHLKSGQYRCLLTETGLPHSQLELLTDEAPINIGKLDSLGTQFPPGPRLYSKLMRYNTEVIRTCLEIRNNDREPATTSERDSQARFILVNQDGKSFSDTDLLGNYQFITFGYTACPDVCPLSLHTMTQALKKLGDQSARITPVFITVDPERDKVAVIREYVSYFSKRLIGLTGSPTMIRQAAKKFGVRFEKVIDDPKQPDNYKMDHTAGFFLIAPDGHFITKLSANLSATQVAEKLQAYLH